jgi:hypothetical protein
VGDDRSVLPVSLLDDENEQQYADDDDSEVYYSFSCHAGSLRNTCAIRFVLIIASSSLVNSTDGLTTADRTPLPSRTAAGRYLRWSAIGNAAYRILAVIWVPRFGDSIASVAI